MQTWPIASDLAAWLCCPAVPRAAVLVLHGFGEHAGRHAATAQVLAARGIAVYAYDHRGHGRSPGRRGFVARFAAAVDETLAMRERVAARHPQLPMFLLGYSMGGLMAICSAQQRPGGLAGVVAVAPALGIGDTVSPALRAASRILSVIAPGLPVAALELAALSRDPQVALTYAADPLNFHGKVSARTGAELAAAGDAALAAAAGWKLPLAIVHGEADRIVPLAGSQRFVAAAGGSDVTLRAVPQAYHEPFNDPGGAALVADVAAWILARAQNDANRPSRAESLGSPSAAP